MFRHSHEGEEDALQRYIDAEADTYECPQCGTVLYRVFEAARYDWRPVAPAEFYNRDRACGECGKFLAEWEARLRPGAPGRYAPQPADVPGPVVGIRIGGLNDG